MSNMNCVFCSEEVDPDSKFCTFCGTSTVAKITSRLMIDTTYRAHDRKIVETEKREKLKKEKEKASKDAENFARVSDVATILDRMQQVAPSTLHHKMAIDLQEARNQIQKLLEDGLISETENTLLFARTDKIEAQTRKFTLLQKQKEFYRSIITSKLFWLLSTLILPVSLLWIIPIILIAKNKGVEIKAALITPWVLFRIPLAVAVALLIFVIVVGSILPKSVSTHTVQAKSSTAGSVVASIPAGSIQKHALDPEMKPLWQILLGCPMPQMLFASKEIQDKLRPYDVSYENGLPSLKPSGELMWWQLELKPEWKLNDRGLAIAMLELARHPQHGWGYTIYLNGPFDDQLTELGIHPDEAAPAIPKGSTMVRSVRAIPDLGNSISCDEPRGGQ